MKKKIERVFVWFGEFIRLSDLGSEFCVGFFVWKWGKRWLK